MAHSTAVTSGHGVEPSSGILTAIVPAAGLGTRFLPTTKAVPKELLPVVDTPGIEHVAAEAAEAGVRRLVIVTSPGKDAVAQYFRAAARARGDPREAWQDRAASRRSAARPTLLDVETAIQEKALGLGHAVGCAEANLRRATTRPSPSCCPTTWSCRVACSAA